MTSSLAIIDPFDVPSADDYLDRVFGPGGYLARRFSNYEMRSGQVSLSRAIDEALAVGEHLMGEGSTGTGKSVGYLVPATYHAATRNKRVIVVTANIALQEQIINKDLPMLAEILPWNFTYSLLKGKNNYLCNKKYTENLEQGFHEFHGSDDDYEQLEQVKAWVETINNQGIAGDISNIDFQPSPKVWREFSVSADECSGSDCKYRDGCHAMDAQAIAREANIIVTNYHLLFAHLSVKQKIGMDVVLPNFDIAILDEVHKAADIARNFFGFSISPEAFRRSVNVLRNGQNSLYVGSRIGSLFEELTKYKKSNRYKTRIKENLTMDPVIGPKWKELKESVDFCINDFGIELVDKNQEYEEMLGYSSTNDPSAKKLRGYINKLSKASDRLKELTSQLKEALSVETAEFDVYSIEVNERGYTSIVGKPIEVGGILNTTLFSETDSVICTSATMSTNGNFNFISNEIGCNEFVSIIVDSPFNWTEQMMLVLPDDMPEPNSKIEFPVAVAEHIEDIIEAANGRTLALFTSYKNMETTFDRISKTSKFKILRQNDMPRTKLIERFKNDISSVLLGTESFWAGVDVPGESLSVVVIDRIPFPTPDDPIMDAISELNPRGWFSDYAIPRAIIALKQGFGRLIRSSTDRGVVVILDNRITTKKYGRQFLRSLPTVPVSTNIWEIARFLDQKSLAEMSDEDYFNTVFS